MSGTEMDFGSDANPLEESLKKSDVGMPDVKEATGPSYRVMGDSKIAVSSSRGKLWKARKSTGKKSMGNFVDAWDEAFRYYNNDQSQHRISSDTMGGDTAGNRHVARKLNDRFSSTENVVFSNVNASVPQLYAKNPVVSVSSGVNSDPTAKEQQEAFARAVEKLVNVLFAMSSSPGVNIKPKMKRAVIIALLTNAVWLEVGYVDKEESSEQALADLLKASTALSTAKDLKTITEIEGQLMALEERIEFLNPAGPIVKLRLPHQVIVDPDHNDSNGSDAKWIMVEDMLPTEYLNAVYGQKNKENDSRYYSVYEPTHLLTGEGDPDGDDTHAPFDSAKNDYNAFGFSDQKSADKAKRTRVVYVWDAVTRRLELYTDNDWKWPVWVWDDPYQLQGFYPFTKLWFHESPTGTYAKGEVSYYLDQQDQINMINDERNRSLQWARRNIVYNKNKVAETEITKMLKGPDGNATGIDVPEGMKLDDLLHVVVPPSFQFAKLFDKQDIYQSIDRIAASNEIERGGQFKTNTTNKAVDYYATQGNMRNDERLDAVEDCIGRVGWQIAQLCLRFMPADRVKELTGLDVQEFWHALDPMRDMNKWNMTCVGGSTQKQTVQAKKQEAVQMGQVLSQFVRAAPGIVLTKTLEVFEDAFDSVVMSTEDWEAIISEVQQMAQMQQGGAPGQAPGAPPGQPPASGGQPQPQPSADGGAAEGQAAVQFLQQLPPEVLQAIGKALQQGAQPQQILAVIQEGVQHGQQQQQQPGVQ